MHFALFNFFLVVIGAVWGVIIYCFNLYTRFIILLVIFCFLENKEENKPEFFEQFAAASQDFFLFLWRSFLGRDFLTINLIAC